MNIHNYHSTLARCLLFAFLAPSPALAAKSVGDLTGPWQLFVDDYLVASSDNVVRRYHPFEKYTNNPILVVDQPWEHNVVSCSTVLPAEDGKGYRMWYYCWAKPNDTSHSLYATSADGIHWEKPKLGLLPWKVNGSTNNNFVGTGGSIMHTPDDPAGKVVPGLRLICRGIPVTSKPVSFADGKYHHLAVTWDDGHVRFYLDGTDVGEAWLPGGAPVVMPRDLLVGDDAELGRTDEQFNGNVDDILVLGRVLNPEDLKAIATKGAEAFFKAEKPGNP